jgi:polyphosphate kinase
VIDRRLSLPVKTEELLEQLAAAKRPLGLRGSASTFQLLRETYYDTSNKALRDRRMALRLCVSAGGSQTVELIHVTSVNLEGVVEETVLQTPITGDGLYATLAGSSEVATRVRDLVDPAALRPIAALDIDREVRELRSGWMGRPAHRVTFDRVVGHVDGSSRAFQELTIVEIGGPAKVSLEYLANQLHAREGVSGDGMDTLERARPAPDQGATTTRADSPHDVRVALLLIRRGEVALADGPSGLVLPSSRGSGEELANELLVDFYGSPDVDTELELVGFAPSKGGGSDLEVWLHECTREGHADADVLWIPLMEVLERVGGPRLRDASLTATLLLLVRSEIGLRLLREAPTNREAPVEIPSVPHPEGVPLGGHPEDRLNKELSILDFNQRVLELAEDPAVPLLERFRFLSIFSSNLDEFFVVRVARLKAEAEDAVAKDDGRLSANELLDFVAIRVRALVARQYVCLTQALLPALARQGVRIRRWDELDARQQAGVAADFERDIFPLLTPRAMSESPGQRFPRLASLGLSLAAVLRDPAQPRPQVTHVRIPPDLPRFMAIPGCDDLIPVEDVVVANAAGLFPAHEIQEIHAFRVSRIGDVDIEGSAHDSFLQAAQDEVDSRPYKPVVRIEVQHTMPRGVRAHLLRELRSEAGAESHGLSRADVFEVDGPSDLLGFGELADLPLEGQGYPRAQARAPLDPGVSVFDRLDQGDLLVHHPYDAFEHSVGRFLGEAARDPDVVAIKLTLYRTGRDSPVMDALMEALHNGKEVSVFVELKARFDEESNISWTHRMTEAGGHVVYGVVGFKTHAKTALVVRRGPNGIRRYVHIGTGNYNAATARFYTDLGLMSADPDLGADLNDFFNELTGSSGPPVKDYRRLWVAPHSLASGILRCIDREIEHARAGRSARIEAKMNGLADKKVIRALYRAATEGVEIDLIVRAICTLRPGVPGLSEGIRVRSILGRFLEHARIYRFENGGQSEYYIGSADWRKRNLWKRVEVLTPVDDAEARRHLRAILDAEFADPRAWILRADGAYERLSGDGIPAQERFLQGD